ncbi:hypothetical protein QLG10_23225 [Pseudomonas sp. V98_8]|jgi:hypothetical protein|uniref:hypothetical protein n=1 Tax=Pseudomonas sp. V98_8 TaxID=3044228 RepID=UPI00249F5301|nr:hypothetical protein [Pseudomonas sp. V98_8]MDI3395348.1 hypothetical protein [Pseudomonas sp. V98_8]
MEITEVSVIRAAREWAAKNDQDDAQAVIDAADAIGKIRYRFTGDEYQKALKVLYQRFTES